MKINEAPRAGISTLGTLALEGHTLIFNRQDITEKWDRLFPLVQGLIPYFWDEYEYPKRLGKVKGWVDNKTDPSFFAKKKIFYRKSDIMALDDNTDARIGQRRLERSMMFATNSLGNELRLAPLVSDVVDSSKAQEIVHAFGLCGISLAKPLLGMIDHRSGDKFMVYDFVRGKSFDFINERHLKFPGYQIAREVIQVLNELFAAAGVIPFDLNDTSFLITPSTNGNRLVLIDMESYIKTI